MLSDRGPDGQRKKVYGPPAVRSRIRSLLVVAVGVGLMAYVLRGAQLDRVVEAVGGARRDLLFLGLVVTLLTYVARAIRWRYLLAPVQRVHFGPALRATVMGFAATSVLPGRVGEIVRPWALAREERMSVSAVLATVVVERLLDLVVILAMFGIALGLLDPGFATDEAAPLAAARAGALVIAAAAAVILWLVFAAAGHPERVNRLVERSTARLPYRWRELARRLSRRFVVGLAVMRRPHLLLISTIWSVAVWALIAGSIWLVTIAFDIAMPLTGAAVVLLLVAVGVAVPTPAGIGGYHAAYQFGATVLYGAPAEAAAGAGLIAHAFAFLPVTIGGIALMARAGLRMRGIGRMLHDAEQEAVPPAQGESESR